MSGISLATGRPAADPSKPQPEGLIGGVMGNITFFQVQMLAYITVFSVSGLVSVWELAFVLLASLYIIVLAKLVFPRITKDHTPAVINIHWWFPIYVAAGSAIGLFLPMAYVLGGFTRGDKVSVQHATPQLFLLACQLFTENILLEHTYVSLPVRVIVPILYTARRLVAIGVWCRAVFAKTEITENVKSDVWPLFGRILAVANLIFWSVNLFAFLVPVFLYRSFRKHFELEEARKRGELPVPSASTGSTGPTSGPSAGVNEGPGQVQAATGGTVREDKKLI